MPESCVREHGCHPFSFGHNCLLSRKFNVEALKQEIASKFHLSTSSHCKGNGCNHVTLTWQLLIPAFLALERP